MLRVGQKPKQGQEMYFYLTLSYMYTRSYTVHKVSDHPEGLP